MGDVTVSEFCDKHRACTDVAGWCRDNSLLDVRMSELWDREDLIPEWRVWIATRNGVLCDRDSRLFGCLCVRQVWHLLDDVRSRTAVEVSEHYANGNATAEELSEAFSEARAVAVAWSASEVKDAAIGDAVWAAVWAAAGDSAVRYLVGDEAASAAAAELGNPFLRGENNDSVGY